MALTQHLTKSLLHLVKDGIKDYHQALVSVPAEIPIPTGARSKHGINLGILLAHQTTLEGAYTEEGLQVKVLNEMAEDIIEVLDMLPALRRAFIPAERLALAVSPTANTLSTTTGEPKELKQGEPNALPDIQDSPQ